MATISPRLIDDRVQAKTRDVVAGNGKAHQPFRDPQLDPERRIDDLLSRLTIDEKIACLSTNPSVPRLGIKCSGHVEGLHGLALGGPGKWGGDHPLPTTTFPQAIGLAQTWDPELIRKVAEVESYECRYYFQSPKYNRGGIVVRAPNADLGRDPRWGRTEECYGEDPFFNGTMTVAFVRGLQGDDPRYWRCASLLKHFLANSNENGREHSSSDFDQRLFREYYARPFQMGIVEGGSRAFMAAYNAYNGIPMHVHPVLRNVARREWGQDGIICTDGGGLKLLVEHHKYYKTPAEAAAWIVKAGIGQFLDKHKEPTEEALAKGYLAEADIDEVVRANFRVMIKLGLLDPHDEVPYTSIGASADEPEPWTREDHKSLVRLATARSVVLLKNEQALLPLDATKLKSIAVVGPRANDVLVDWYSGTPPYMISALHGIRERASCGDVTVEHACDGPDAIELARRADVAIVVVGNHVTCNAGWAKTLLPSDGKEAVDRASITLEQEELVKQVMAVNPRTVLVLISSFPYAINWSAEHVPAILHITHNSQELGTGLADVLFGDVNPAGRLVQTWPKSIDDLPEMMDYDLRHGRTYLYSTKQPLFPFGYGLSYTTFDYANLRASTDKLSADGSLQVTFDVTNTGSRAGDEVVQLYVKHLDSAVERPIKELKAFRRVPLEAGHTKSVTLELKAEQLAYWDVARQEFVVEPDRVELMVGGSSEDIRLCQILKVFE